jgi:hypothetical protein
VKIATIATDTEGSAREFAAARLSVCLNWSTGKSAISVRYLFFLIESAAQLELRTAAFPSKECHFSTPLWWLNVPERRLKICG